MDAARQAAMRTSPLVRRVETTSPSSSSHSPSAGIEKERSSSLPSRVRRPLSATYAGNVMVSVDPQGYLFSDPTSASDNRKAVTNELDSKVAHVGAGNPSGGQKAVSKEGSSNHSGRIFSTYGAAWSGSTTCNSPSSNPWRPPSPLRAITAVEKNAITAAESCTSRAPRAMNKERKLFHVMVRLSEATGLPQQDFPVGWPVKVFVEFGSHRWHTSVMHTASADGQATSTISKITRSARAQSGVLQEVSRDFELVSLDEVLRIILVGSSGEQLTTELPLSRVRSEATSRALSRGTATSSRTFTNFTRSLRLRTIDSKVSGEIPVTVTLHQNMVPTTTTTGSNLENGRFHEITGREIAGDVRTIASAKPVKRTVRYWMHATSEDNYHRIHNDGVVVPSLGTVDASIDAALFHPLAPRGIWFDANGTYIEREGVPYPVSDSAMANAWGLLGDVNVLLGTTEGHWQVFRVSSQQVGNWLRVSYAVVLAESPEYWWLRNRSKNAEGHCHCVQLSGNQDEHMALLRADKEQERWEWLAVDAQARISVEVFLAIPLQAPVPRGFFHPEPLQLRHCPELNFGMRDGGRLPGNVYGARACGRDGWSQHMQVSLPDTNRMLGRFVPVAFAPPSSLRCDFEGEVMTEARLPQKICFDQEGRLLVACQNGVVRVVAQDGRPVETQHVRVRFGRDELQLRAVGSDWGDGSILVAGGDVVIRVFPYGTSEVVAADPGLSDSFRPSAFCISDDGHMLVASMGGCAIVRFACPAPGENRFDSSESAQVVLQLGSAPRDLCALADGSLLVLTDGELGSKGGRVLRWYNSSKPLEILVKGLVNPRAMCCGPDGALYVCEASHVRRFSSPSQLGVSPMQAVDGIILALDCGDPQGICFDCFGHLYISDVRRGLVSRYRALWN